MRSGARERRAQKAESGAAGLPEVRQRQRRAPER
nr:MAG TPA: hypothetical protein [Caudoviricetes sp.]